MDSKIKAQLDRHATCSNIRDLLDDNRANTHKSATEEQCYAALPGDDVDASIPNRYLTLACSRPLQVKQLIESGELSARDAQEAVEALQIYSALSGDRV